VYARGGSSRRKSGGRESALLTLSAALLVLVLAVLAYLVVISPMDGSAQTVATSGLASWNPHVACSADSVAVQDVLGPGYPSQDLSGSRYQKNSTDGGVPSKRALSPPCSITNSAGQSVSTFVQIDGVYLSTYTFDSHDCSTQFKRVNGGGPYPNNETFCDNVGNILQVGTTSGQIHIEFDQDWLAADYCGSDVPSCDNVTIAQQQSNGDISLDVQGFVYWDGDHWELHPFTAWKPSGSPPPPPPPNAPPTVDFTWTPATGDNTTVFSFTATASDDHDLSSAIQVRWDWQGDGVWDTQWSTTKTASHQYHSAGNKTVIIEAMDSGGLASTQSHVVRVSAPSPPPPPSNAPPTVDFAWTPNSGNTSTIFSFNATAADDHDSPTSIQVRWDWTGDGTWDTAWSPTKTGSQSYSSAGNKTVVVQAMDSGGLTSTRSHVVRVTASPPPPPPPNAPPSVDFTWTPTSGDTTTVFTFTAQASDDHDQASAIQVRWDWNGDATWDTTWSTTKTATHTFSSAGSYTVVVQAADSGGLAAIQSHEVSVTIPPPPPPPPPGDFSIGASPTSLTILCGSSGSSTITLTSLNGLSGSASLSPSISSSGLVLIWPTGSVSPGTVTLAADGTATSTLTISTSLLTTPGTYTVTVTATIGSVTHSVSLTVVVKLL